MVTEAWWWNFWRLRNKLDDPLSSVSARLFLAQRFSTATSVIRLVYMWINSLSYCPSTPRSDLTVYLFLLITIYKSLFANWNMKRSEFLAMFTSVGSFPFVFFRCCSMDRVVIEMIKNEKKIQKHNANSNGFESSRTQTVLYRTFASPKRDKEGEKNLVRLRWRDRCCIWSNYKNNIITPEMNR